MPRCHWNLAMVTVSAAGGVPGSTVRVALTVVVPKALPVIVVSWP
jgi:hypothetical protein